MTFIALGSLHGANHEASVSLAETRYHSETDGGRVVDESVESGLRYINPSLILPLEDVWVSKGRTHGARHVLNGDGDENV